MRTLTYRLSKRNHIYTHGVPIYTHINVYIFGNFSPMHWIWSASGIISSWDLVRSNSIDRYVENMDEKVHHQAESMYGYFILSGFRIFQWRVKFCFGFEIFGWWVRLILFSYSNLSVIASCTYGQLLVPNVDHVLPWLLMQFMCIKYQQRRRHTPSIQTTQSVENNHEFRLIHLLNMCPYPIDWIIGKTAIYLRCAISFSPYVQMFIFLHWEKTKRCCKAIKIASIGTWRARMKNIYIWKCTHASHVWFRFFWLVAVRINVLTRVDIYRRTRVCLAVRHQSHGSRLLGQCWLVSLHKFRLTDLVGMRACLCVVVTWPSTYPIRKWSRNQRLSSSIA